MTVHRMRAGVEAFSLEDFGIAAISNKSTAENLLIKKIDFSNLTTVKLQKYSAGYRFVFIVDSSEVKLHHSQLNNRTFKKVSLKSSEGNIVPADVKVTSFSNTEYADFIKTCCQLQLARVGESDLSKRKGPYFGSESAFKNHMRSFVSKLVEWTFVQSINNTIREVLRAGSERRKNEKVLSAIEEKRYQRIQEEIKRHLKSQSLEKAYVAYSDNKKSIENELIRSFVLEKSLASS